MPSQDSLLPNPRKARQICLIGRAGTLWIPIKIPRYASMVYMIAGGGGGGGGGGQSAGAAAAGGGGGGGGSGGIARLLIPSTFLPDIMYCFPGNGGAAVAAAVAGQAGTRSFISDQQTSTQQDLILQSETAAAGGGAVGAVSAAGGSAGSLATNILQQYSAFGIWTAIAGQAGTASGASGAVGATLTYGANGIPFSGGTGGGSTNTSTGQFAGGPITGAGLVPTMAGGTAGGGAGNAGFNNGCMINMGTFATEIPHLVVSYTGGTGGGAHASGTGGSGGQGVRRHRWRRWCRWPRLHLHLLVVVTVRHLATVYRRRSTGTTRVHPPRSRLVCHYDCNVGTSTYLGDTQ
jgi:hypothetical protein